MNQSKKNINKEILNTYLPADNYVVINEDDKALHPVFIKLPDAPPLHTIDGYGLPAHEQKFVRQVMPHRLIELQNTFDTIDEIWNELEENGQDYQKEIAWIKLQWYRRLNGYWCFINGKPIYFNGWNYTYINFWKFQDGSVLEFRERNRKLFHAFKYAYTATEIPIYDDIGVLVYKDEIVNGVEMKIPSMKDIGIRVLHGITYPKNRRDGATNSFECAKFCETTIRSGVHSGMVSSDGPHCKKLFSEITVVGWQGMPFFFKPIHDGFDNPEEIIKFFAPKKKGMMSKRQKALRSMISHSGTAQPTFYDGSKMFWLNLEEGGKTTEVDIVWRHDVLKKTIGQGSGIDGFMGYPSTVGEMTAKGGHNYFRLCEQSHWEKRDSNGRTTSGLMNIFFSSVEGLEKFIDPWGNSVIESPTIEQVIEAKKDPLWKEKYHYAVYGIGSREFLMNERQAKIDAKDIDGHNEAVRLFPLKYVECFRGEDGDAGFNTVKLNERIDELKFTFKKLVRRGNFKWKDDIIDGEVIWEDDEKGRWYLSKMLQENERNLKYSDTIFKDGDWKTMWFPINPKFTASADPFKYNKTKGKRMSDGGGAVFWDFDKSIDGNKDIKHWQSHRLVCTYRNRPSDLNDYCEDMLMMTVFFGAMMYPEINVAAVWKHFDDRGYGGFLKYDIDTKSGNFSNTPGFNSLEKSKQDLFNCARDFIEKHAHREVHLDYLMECKDIIGLEDMTNWDLFVAGSGAIMGSKSNHSKIISINTAKMDIGEYVQERTYN